MAKATPPNVTAPAKKATRAKPPAPKKPKVVGRESGKPEEDDDYGGSGRFGLWRTDVPGVFRNRDGALVDAGNVLLSLRQVQAAEEAHVEEVLGEPVETPKELLLRIVKDPTLPLSMRMQAAVSAAPYYDRKMPLALEGGDPERPLRTETTVMLKKLNALGAEERRAALRLLETLGVLPPANPE